MLTENVIAKKDSMINVTQTFLPPIEEYTEILNRAWDKKWITNRAPLILELEEKLKARLGVNNITIAANGTLPLQIAVKLLAAGGEVITTPFSYVATTAAIVWENCTPVFVDIDPRYLTIDETKIEAAITSRTTAILATHVFGNPCHVDAIEAIADKHGLKVIYDAAHCFGVKYKGQSIFNFGDMSTCSFHATKIFHTAEGGAMFCKDEALRHKFFYSHNFGHNSPHDFFGVGINAKISELQAAMGLAVVPYLDMIFSERRKVVEFYDEHLDFSHFRGLTLRDDTEWNYSYYPVILESEEQLLKKLDELRAIGVLPRRYFYPSLNTVEYTNGKAMPVSESIASRIFCLPLYVGLERSDLKNICEILNN
jgi:dTDP-4-amino-4,6-dideoxygalactose transaminase